MIGFVSTNTIDFHNQSKPFRGRFFTFFLSYVWFVVCGVWSVVCGLWSVVYVVWYDGVAMDMVCV